MIRNITTTIPKQFGGRTRLILRRINLVHEAMNIKQDIITTNYNIDYPDIISNLKESNELPKSIEHINIYDYYSGNKLFCKSPSFFFKLKSKFEKHSLTIDGLTDKLDEKNHCVRYYRNIGGKQQYVKYRKYDSEFNRIIFEDEFCVFTKKRIKRKEYDKNGRMHRITIYNPNNDFKLLDRLYDNESRLFCERRYYKNNKIRGIILYKNDKVFKSFKGEREFFIDFFNNVFNDGDIVFNDARLLDRANFAQTKDTKNVIVYHSTERELNGELKPSYVTTLNNEAKVSKYITSTEIQKDSLINNYEIPKEKVNVISSYIDPVSQISYRDNSDIIYVGRLDENKQVKDIIIAFNTIKDEIPEDCILRIYGDGPDLMSLKNYIKNLKLEKRVKFMGFANNLDEVYKTAKLSVLTSKFEGFALSVMESINYGCPIVAYDIEYGPSEIITQFETGVLVEKNNVKMLAEIIKNIINDEITFENVKTKEKFTKESVQNRFIYLINELGGN